MNTLAIANDYGNVDVRKCLPSGYVHVPGERLQPLCRKLKIKFAPAMVGFTKAGRYWRAETNGVVVSTRSAEKLTALLRQRESKPKPTAEQRAAQKARRQEREIKAFAAAVLVQYPSCPDAEYIASRACAVGSGRAGRTRTLGTMEAVTLAVWAYARHNYTNYDSLLAQGMERDEARAQVGEQVAALLEQWEAN